MINFLDMLIYKIKSYFSVDLSTELFTDENEQCPRFASK